MPETGYSLKPDENERLEKQPPELYLMLRSLSFARRLSSLYSTDHPSAVAAMTSLTDIMESYIIGLRDRSLTCVFTRDAVIVNDRSYKATFESCDIHQRLRERGVMAITLIQGVTDRQISHFVDFLNAEPLDVNAAGGPREYLQRLGVSRIVATEAIYTRDDDSEDDSDLFDNSSSVSSVVDNVIGAAISWLSRQDDDDSEEVPLLPIIDILSDPDMAAKLIREAVTKLHASRTNASTRELANEVVNDLKDMASSDKDRWDEAAPQIRRAISKLPDDMRPIAPGLTEEKPSSEQASKLLPLKIVNINDVEEQLTDMAKPKSDSLLDENDGQPIDLRSLFDIQAEGMLSKWSKELQPVSILRSCGRTYETLMAWQTNASEHGRIARVFATLIPKAVEIEDFDSSLLLAEGLIKESKRDDGMIWRRSNALAALESVDLKILQAIVQKTLSSGDYQNKEIASQIVESIPRLALNLVHLLGVYRSELFDESLKNGLAQEVRGSLPSLSIILRTGNPPARMSALETLVKIGTLAAMKEISDTLDSQDDLIVIKALSLLPAVQKSYSTEMCINALSHKSSEVKCAAISALGVIGGDAILPYITRVISGRFYGAQEKVIAIEVLGDIGGVEHVPYLQKIVEYHPFIGRNRYEKIRSAAKNSVGRIQERLSKHADNSVLQD
ncbi:MAG: HEAT repeat domain-containing protein [Armatimonadota bacterium]